MQANITKGTRLTFDDICVSVGIEDVPNICSLPRLSAKRYKIKMCIVTREEKYIRGGITEVMAAKLPQPFSSTTTVVIAATTG